MLLESKKKSTSGQEKERLRMVKADGLALRFIENPSEAVQLVAVSQCGYAIQFIKKPSETVHLAAVNQDGYVIQCIKKPSEVVQLAAINNHASAIQHIENPSEAVQLMAVRNHGSAIGYIKKPSKAVQFEAVSQNGLALRYIKRPCEAVREEAVNQNGWSIQFIKKPSEAMHLAAFANAGPCVIGAGWCFAGTRPSASEMALAIQSARHPFDFNAPAPRTARLQYARGVGRLVNILCNEPPAGIQILIATAPGLFKNNALKPVYERAMLLGCADSTTRAVLKRSI